MLSKELLDQVQALNDDDKLALLNILIDDLALGEHGYEIFGFRGNAKVAEVLVAELEKFKASLQPEIE